MISTAGVGWFETGARKTALVAFGGFPSGELVKYPTVGINTEVSLYCVCDQANELVTTNSRLTKYFFIVRSLKEFKKLVSIRLNSNH
jgi:hypothetical protein